MNVVLAVLATWALAGITGWLVASHPEPAADEPDADIKPHYADLVSAPAAALAGLVALLALAPLLVIPLAWWPAWIVWAGAFSVLALVDARTTWLPHRAQLFAEIALLVGLVRAVLASPATRGQLGRGVLLGCLIAAALFALVWWFSGALGFGDVRLAAGLGALTGLAGWDAWYAGLLAATVAGAVGGLLVWAWRRRRPSPLGKAFAYGPALWLGPYLGLAWLQLS